MSNKTISSDDSSKPDLTADITDLVIIGGGAAGLMAAISAARAATQIRIIILDGAKKLGAKILVAGGGRCNVTHHQVSEQDYAGGSKNSIKKVLRRFNVQTTIRFFEQLGVPLKHEETGKLFPQSDSAKDILAALIDEAKRLNINIQCRKRVYQIQQSTDHFIISGDWGHLRATRIILATGGKSLPKSGSDGFGYSLANSLGHTLTATIDPALVPLVLPKNHFICQLSGLTLTTSLSVLSPTNKIIKQFTGSTLCTHFGLSGPAVLDISRYWLAAYREDQQCQLQINWLPEFNKQTFEALLLSNDNKKTVRNFLKYYLPIRLADMLCSISDIDTTTICSQLRKQQRKQLLENTFNKTLPIEGDRGFNFAEVTAGGIPLNEINPNTMASRISNGLYLCGEICDVDGRIGGFNFQWAWASGFIAGTSAATDLTQ